MFAFARDDAVAELLKAATGASNFGDWGSALRALAEAKQRMLVSPVAYPAAMWCKYPLYLQKAGCYEESMREFEFLLADLERRARRDSHLDDPRYIGNKHKCYKIILETDAAVIREKMALAQTRQVRAGASASEKSRGRT